MPASIIESQIQRPLEVSETKRLKAREEESANLRCGARANVEGIAHLMEQHAMSKRRICKSIGYRHDHSQQPPLSDRVRLRNILGEGFFYADGLDLTNRARIQADRRV